MQAPVVFQVSLTGRPATTPPAELVARLSKRSSVKRQEALEDRQSRAESKRQELRMTRLAKRKRGAEKATTAQPDTSRKLQVRLERAATKRSTVLEQRRGAASRFLSRRAGALARAELQREAQLERHQEAVQQEEGAGSRRALLQQLHLERLRQEHSWVQSRLDMHHEGGNAVLLDSKRRQLDSRLSLAGQARTLQLDLRAARAGVEVARARAMCHASQARRSQRAETARARLQDKMAAAEQRRLALLAAHHTCTGRTPRTSSA